jgi:glycosyltransferase involved in cell wall biosynthesis
MSRRLLFLTERYPPDLGGVAVSAGRISRSLAAMDLEVDVVSWTRALEPGVVVSDPGPPAVYRMGRFREWSTTLPHALNLLDWLISRQPYDAVWGHYLFPGGFLAAWLAQVKGIRSAISIRGNDLDRDMFPTGDFARLLWTLEHADCITAVTAELAAKAAALSSRDDIVTVRNVVDTDRFTPAPAADRARLGIAPEETVLGFCGELREKKGQRFLLDALRRVRETRPACLLVIGEARPSIVPELLGFDAEATLDGQRIVITGQLNDPAQVNAHLQLCDVYLQPSLWDGMPNALLEAMAAGCLCIASDAGGNPEAILDGVHGVLLPRWELARLGDVALKWLDADSGERQRLRTAARARMIAEFNPEVERRQLAAVLDRLMPNSR